MTSCLPFILVMSISIAKVVPFEASQNCQFNYSYVNGVSGNFSSPGFPKYYPSLLRCAYLFDAAKNGGVEIKFDAFELEDKKEGDDAYDYIDVFTISSQNFRTFLNRFCGRKIPHTIISPQSKLEIKFVTDHWQNSATGFHGRYRFLGNDWQPFDDHKPSKCGNDSIFGVAGYIHSPNYPDMYPADVNCSWVINVPAKYRILVRLLDLDIGSSARCTDSALRLYNGFASPMTVFTKEWCGRFSIYETSELQYRTYSNRTVIRFVTGSRDDGRHKGFKLLWMAFTLPEPPEMCHGFQCEGGHYCHNGIQCSQLPKYCISKSLVCDGVRNCGPYDDSDERKCTREILIMATCISVPSIVLLMMVVLVVYCYKSRHVKKSTSQDQPLANSQSQGNTSRESFTSNHRQMMLHTSFIDGAGAMPPDPDHDLHHDTNDIDQETTRGLFSDGATNSLRTHKKRPSYHMMQQNYEDGNLIIAQI